MSEPSVTRGSAERRAAGSVRAIALEWLALALLIAKFVGGGLVPAWNRLNTDFPNYYLAARLYRAGFPLDRLYDWVWFQRQKDHAGIEPGVVGYVPLSPFSALAVVPFASLSPLAAKRCWLGLSALLLAATLALLHELTHLPIRRVAMVAFLAVVPLATCFEFGQQLLLILFLFTLAAWLYVRGHGASSGAVLAAASVFKVYPVLFVLFFLRKRQWRALAGLCLTLALLIALGAALFGPETLHVYASQVLPRTLAGEATDPYHLGANSSTALLRRLFVAEPELNPHPLVHAPAAYVLLQPLIPTSLLLSALWLISPCRGERAQETLEWGAFVSLPLVLSPGSASYHLCGLILATALGVDFLLGAGRLGGAVALVASYALVCSPLHRLAPVSPSGWSILLGVPRLYGLLGYWGILLWALARVATRPLRAPGEARAFAVAFVLLLLVGVAANVRHFDGQLETAAQRIPLEKGTLIATGPVVAADGVYFSGMEDYGYGLERSGSRLAVHGPLGTDLFHPAVAQRIGEGWVEASSHMSRVARFPLDAAAISVPDLPTEVENAEQPAISLDGRWLAFLREQKGRGSLWVADRGPPEAPRRRATDERQIVDATRDVLDLAFLPDGQIVFSAREGFGSGLYVTSTTPGPTMALPTHRASRYPAASPDGRWLAYSEQERSAWQLELMDMATHEQRRLTRGDCNSIMPAWEPDSKALVYATDCGRGIGHTALCRLSVVH
jgi:Glycosyltransferase family 87/WD40-like Beta Propeller Repeat